MADNVKMEREGNTLVITVDLSKDYGPSKSEKNMKVATTGGNVEIPGAPGHYLGLNVYRKKDAEPVSSKTKKARTR